MGEVNTRDEAGSQVPKAYDKIELTLTTASDKLCMMEHLVDFESELGEIQNLLQSVETDAKEIENFRLSALARAVFLMLGKVKQCHQMQPDTYAYLIYSMRTIVRLAGVSRYAAQTGFEALDATYGEAISAIIDHTDELTAPHMRR